MHVDPDGVSACCQFVQVAPITCRHPAIIYILAELAHRVETIMSPFLRQVQVGTEVLEAGTEAPFHQRVCKCCPAQPSVHQKITPESAQRRWAKGTPAKRLFRAKRPACVFGFELRYPVLAPICARTSIRRRGRRCQMLSMLGLSRDRTRPQRATSRDKTQNTAMSRPEDLPQVFPLTHPPRAGPKPDVHKRAQPGLWRSLLPQLRAGVQQ
jgi:hypothetical protein